MKNNIIPSIIAQSQVELNSRLNKIKSLKPRLIQLDVMDGQFVKHTSLEFEVELPRHVYEAHLMIAHPLAWLKHNHKMVKSVIAHYESDVHMHEFIKQSKRYKLKVGIALNPETPIESIRHYLKFIDKVLILTVNPGAYGSKFLPNVLDKVTIIRAMRPDIDIEVDGGINPKTIKKCIEAGANQFVVGSFLQKAKNVSSAWNSLARVK